ncbi:armadillo repeat-containing protein 2 isoform X3 [Cuculus canorus]|uniref:armadillo repeat-containing protein 2 isoform X3 n=1 Tax=Cuculus canorus TaxID=55661 RepID=UPI0023AA44BF|nr:armadillo repeat-containing protein 2 isoform X3 [Cuculus canorus]
MSGAPARTPRFAGTAAARARRPRLHAPSSDLAELRPVTGVRLSPLAHKRTIVASAKDEDSTISLPKLPTNDAEVRKVSSARKRTIVASAKDEDSSIFLPRLPTNDAAVRKVNSAQNPMLLTTAKDGYSSIFLPKPPADNAGVRKVSSAQACLFRKTSKGYFHAAKMVPLDQNEEKPDSEEPAMMSNLCRSNTNCLAERRSYAPSNDVGRQLNCKKHISRLEREDFLKWTEGKSLFQLRGESRSVNSDGSFADEEQQLPCDQMKKPGTSSSRPTSTGLKRRVAGLEDETRLNESEEEENFWCRKILPILRELEKDESGWKKSQCLQACIGRNEKNDYIIQKDRLLDCLLEVLRTEDLHKNNAALLYCMGAIKFLSGNAVLLNEMVSKGGVEKLLQLMKQINNIKENDTYFSNSGHLLVQLTATLRNLADLPLARSQLICSGAVSELSVALQQRMSDKDVCTYIVRIFSKLSSYDDFCAALADCSRCYILFLALLNKHQKRQDLVIRIIFILGNLTAKNNQAREQFFKEKGSVNTLISLFQTYYERDLNTQKCYHERAEKGKNHPKRPSEAEDVLIKLIRVLANLSIHPSVGAALAAAHRVVDLLVTVLEYKSVDDCEELVVNTMITINNLSYYKVKDSAVQDKKLYIAEMLLKPLMSNNMDGIVEAVRVFGNLSQDHEICDFIVEKKIYKFMITLLDAKNQDVCFSACGVLLNLTVDKNNRAFLMEEGGIGKLVDCLQDFGPADWQLACLICKTLWNYSENITSAASCFGEDTDTLLMLLTSLLDEELVLDYSLEGDVRDYKLYWEREFKPVAEKLLGRIKSHHLALPAVTVDPF